MSSVLLLQVVGPNRPENRPFPSIRISLHDIFGRCGNNLVPMVDYRCGSLLSLPSYDVWRSIDEKFRRFSVSLGDLATTRRFLEEVGGHFSLFSQDVSTASKRRKVTTSTAGGHQRSLITPKE